MAYAYRHTLGGHGPYQSEAFDTEEEATQAAEERGHTENHELIDLATGNSSNRERIDLDAGEPGSEPTA